ncbi:MAG: galactose mutarotase [Clostridia bacterium]|nr:galactose mutarotase [Clostridia bacterium]
MEKKSFGKLSDGREVFAFVIKNGRNMQVTLSEYGACITSLLVPDRDGILADVVLGFDDVSGYESPMSAHMGAITGRFAGRIRNGRFMLEGKPVILNCNDGKNHLHGGKGGLHRKLWHGSEQGENSVAFTYESADGEENYPGNLSLCVTYTLDDGGSLCIDYKAKSDKTTVLNLTNHSYFNLKGHEKGAADTQVLRINADRYATVDMEKIPDGAIMPTECTPMDFRTYAVINSRIGFDFIQLRYGEGYDHSFVLNKRERNLLSTAAELYDAESGRHMLVHTTMPALQFYSGNSLEMTEGKGGALYMKRGGVCLETQFIPNAMEHTYFPSPILRADEEYHHITRYTFSVRDIDPKCYS